MPLRSPYAAVVLSILAIIGCLAMLALVPYPTLLDWTREDAFFEMGSVVGYWLAMVIALLMARRDPKLFTLSAVLLFLFGARELDWHKAFTTDSVLKSNYYLKSAAPLTEKLIAGAVVLLIFALVIYYLACYLRPFLQGLLRRSPPAISIACTFVLLAFTKVVDRSVSVLEVDYGVRVPEWVERLQTALEEPLEFFIPILILLALYQTWASARR
jgi:hypothetical protein